MKLPALWGIRISLFVSVFILLACGPASNPEESEEPTRDREELPIIYSMTYGKLSDEDEWRHEYGEGMPKRRVVEQFLASRKTPVPSKDSTYVKVDILPSVHAQVYDRQSDLFLEGTDLQGFINYYVEGNRSSLPERQVDILLAHIQTDLSELSRMLGVDPPRVRIERHSYLWSSWQVDPTEVMEVRRTLENNDIVYDVSPEVGIELEKANVCEIM